MQFVKIADMCLIREKFEPLRNVIFLAMIFNSTIIEISKDKFWISHCFQGCQTLRYIARLSENLKMVILWLVST